MTKEAEKTIEKKVSKTAASHTVKTGERLSDIATKNGLSVRKLAKLNELPNFNVKEGTVLKFS